MRRLPRDISSAKGKRSIAVALLYVTLVSGRAGFLQSALGEELPDLIRRPRVAEQITLHLGAADRLQRLHLLLGFHAFRGRRHVEAFCQSGDSIHDRKRFCTIGKILDERAVDLDLVEGETAKIAER